MDPTFIISHSARALVGSAECLDVDVCSADAWGDSDHAGWQHSSRSLPLCPNGAWRRRPLYAHVRRLLQEYPRLRLICGSGFEADPSLLRGLSGMAPLWANSADTVERCNRPEQLFPLLRELSIPVPDTCYGQPCDGNTPEGPGGSGGDWLVKQIGGTGGGHVRPWSGAAWEPRTEYLQRRALGESMSMVFIADGTGGRILGFSRQFQSQFQGQFQGGGGFLFRGAMRLPSVEPGMRRRLRAWMDALVSALGLRGVCGLDFLADADGDRDGECRLLEINPHPPASLELHERDSAGFLRETGQTRRQSPDFSACAWHAQACQGILPEPMADTETGLPPVRMLWHVFAVRDFTVPCQAHAWPAWAVNRPRADRVCRKGEPVCSILASGQSEAEAQRKRRQRMRHLRHLLPGDAIA